jgi:hypothetical protein
MHGASKFFQESVFLFAFFTIRNVAKSFGCFNKSNVRENIHVVNKLVNFIDHNNHPSQYIPLPIDFTSPDSSFNVTSTSSVSGMVDKEWEICRRRLAELKKLQYFPKNRGLENSNPN